MKKICLAAAFIICATHVYAQQTAGKTSFNAGWEFVRDVDTGRIQQLPAAGNQSIAWEKVSLPHTPRLEPVIKTTFEQWQGNCYYRKFFWVQAADSQKHIALQFDGAMHEADVYLNGVHIFKHLGGYLPFYIDISSTVKFGVENCILLKLNNQDNPHIPPAKPMKDLDFNYYGGLYRNAWLVVTNKLHITNAVAANHEAGGGILTHYEDVTQTGATLLVNTEVVNDHAMPQRAQVRLVLRDSGGRPVVQVLANPQTVTSGAAVTFAQRLAIANPQLWAPAHPYLYTLEVAVLQNGKKVEGQTIKTGIKTIRFEAGGFYLNGEKLALTGADRHQEYPYIGYALPDNAQYRDAWKIKAAGFNIVRCSHYPPSPAFLDACDSLGILVMDAIPGWQYFGDETFQQNSLQNIRDMVRRDRNHPSIIMWEVSLNETDMSKPFMDTANSMLHTELPFDGVYTAGWEDYVYDVFIPARQHAKAPDYWKKYAKKKPLFTAEYGDWEYYAQNAGFNQTAYQNLKKEERNSRQLRTDGQERMLQQALNFQEAHNDNLYGPQVGDAVWVMFDYKRGYATDIQSSGMMDIYRLPKFVYYFYQSQYGPVPDALGFGKPMLFIANYWANPADTVVKVFSNCTEVELRVNGVPFSRQKPDTDANSTNLPHPPFTFRIPKWAAGKLEAAGYVKGKKVAETTRETPGAPFAVKLTIDYSGKKITVNNDVIFVYASVADKRSTVVPDAGNPIHFTVKGGGQIIGDTTVKAEAGIATMLLKITDVKKDIIILAQGGGLENGQLLIKAPKP